MQTIIDLRAKLLGMIFEYETVRCDFGRCYVCAYNSSQESLCDVRICNDCVRCYEPVPVDHDFIKAFPSLRDGARVQAERDLFLTILHQNKAETIKMKFACAVCSGGSYHGVELNEGWLICAKCVRMANSRAQILTIYMYVSVQDIPADMVKVITMLYVSLCWPKLNQ